MSADCITLDEAVAELSGYLEREQRLCALAVPAGVGHHIAGALSEVRRLRRLTEPGSSLAHLADRLERHLEALWLLAAPTAADLVAAGVDVEEALERVDRAAARMGGQR